MLSFFIQENAISDLYAVILGGESEEVDPSHVASALWLLNKVMNMQNRTYAKLVEPLGENHLKLFKKLNLFLTVYGKKDPEISLGSLRLLLALMLKCDSEEGAQFPMDILQ